MVDYIQETFREIEEHFARQQRIEIGEEATQIHLANQFARYGKWKGFSKDPEFIKRCEYQRGLLIKQMTRKRDGR